MRKRRLLDRQISLLAHLTDPRAFAGSAAPDTDIAGIEPARLRLVGEMSLGKRMEKVAAILPKTVTLLGPAMEALTAAFAARYPPQTARAIDNARQFHDFLNAHWRKAQPQPPFLPDIAAVEMALGEMINRDATMPTSKSTRRNRGTASSRHLRTMKFRRSPAIEEVNCAHDVRAFLEADGVDAVPVARDVFLVVAPPRKGHGPRVFEIAPELHDLLDQMKNWVETEQIAAWLGDNFNAAIAKLIAAGIVETAP